MYSSSCLPLRSSSTRSTTPGSCGGYSPAPVRRGRPRERAASLAGRSTLPQPALVQPELPLGCVADDCRAGGGRAAGPSRPARAVLGFITAAGAPPAIGGLPPAGAPSDRSTSRLGRRRPFMIVGVILNVCALLALAYAPTLVLLAVAFWLVGLAYNNGSRDPKSTRLN